MQNLNLLTRADVCKALQVCGRTLRTYEKAGRLPVIKVNQRVLRYREEDIQRFLQESTSTVQT